MDDTSNTAAQTSKLLTVTASAGLLGVTEASLRWLLFHRAENGLSRACVRLGRRLLLDRAELLNWVHDQREHAA